MARLTPSIEVRNVGQENFISWSVIESALTMIGHDGREIKLKMDSNGNFCTTPPKGPKFPKYREEMFGRLMEKANG